MRMGDPADQVILLEEGFVKVVSASPNGYVSLLALRGTHDLVGELSCLDSGLRSASVIAMSTVRGVVIPAARFTELLEADCALANAVLRSMGSRLRHSDGHRAALGASSAAFRVAQVLVEVSARYGTEAPQWAPRAFSVELTQQEIASAAGTSRESVVRTLRELHRRELVVTGRGFVVVLDPGELESWDPENI